MRLSTQQLSQQLTQQLQTAYLLVGNELLLRQEAQAMIRRAARIQGFSARKKFTVDTNFDWQVFNNEVVNYSLFAEQQIIELNLTTSKLSKDADQHLVNYLQTIPQQHCLMITLEKLDKTVKSAWIKWFEKQGVIVNVWPIMPKQYPGWLRQQLQRKNLQTSNEALQYLVAHTEGNLLAARQEIEKLYLLYGAGDLSTEQVVTAITDNSRYSIYDLIDMALQGDITQVKKISAHLKAEGIEPTLVLWSLAKDIRTLTRICFGLKQKKPLAALLNNEKVWEKRKPLFKQATQQHTYTSCNQLLLWVADVDLMIKGIKSGCVWQQLMQIALQLAGFNTLEQGYTPYEKVGA